MRDKGFDLVLVYGDSNDAINDSCVIYELSFWFRFLFNFVYQNLLIVFVHQNCEILDKLFHFLSKTFTLDFGVVREIKLFRVFRNCT